jgi:dipeptidase
MDLLRLALERAATAAEAVDVIVALMEAHGQGGGCGHEHRSFTYHNSYLVADPARAFVLETAGRLWAVEEVGDGVRTISNGLTIAGFADRHRDRLRSRVAACDVRTALTTRLAEGADGAGALMTALRSHGPREWPRYRFLGGTLAMPCMHGGGVAAGSLTTASWVADLGAAPVHWVTATSSPCLGIFKPVRVQDPVDMGPTPTDRFDEATVWWRHERLARGVMRDPGRAARHLPERDRVEQEWLAGPPSGEQAFAEADRLTASWREAAPEVGDRRPWWIQGYWRKRDRKAGLSG